MLENLRPLLYLKLTSRHLSGVHLPSGNTFDEPPLLATQTRNGKREAVAVGHEAMNLQGRPDIELLNGFEHPRSLLANFSIAEKTLQLFLRRLGPRSLFKAAPTVILHPLEHLEGGLTQVETRGLYELCRSAGAHQVQLWVGRELSHEELRNRQFPADGGSLLTP
ncbi:rod shape-determining protein [Pseudomonas sp. LS44]|uniref:rod shape-determining protein n=1 Tax=Pseudomonas sp. LS44 TaxID=1357074 RepID=UPI00215A40E6|nr:rod shape-determining protein [Pseudomonas sp. LS44]UVE18842.1 rod shape-determining protein [Pseudomonas sp. LS44]